MASTGRTLLRGGTLVDPANAAEPRAGDLWIEAGKLIPPPADGLADKIVDISGLVVMPGGVDIHAHVAGPKVNLARKLRPEDRRDPAPLTRRKSFRSGTLGSTPSTFATGYLYAGLGYTTVFDAAVPPLGARHAHEEFHDTPLIDKGFFVLAANNHYVLEQLQQNEPDRLRAFLGHLLCATKGYAIKAVNPGGVEAWKRGSNDLVGLDENIDGFDITPRRIINGLATAVDELRLPHALHLHCNRLGMPGNFATTLETMRALEGRRAHLTHIQFHSYGGHPDRQHEMRSMVPELAEYFNAHHNLTADVGQVVFGDTTSMTGDGPLGYYLARVTGRKWLNSEVECEAGCGIVPITYSEKSFVSALQWVIGLEWYLLVDDPWRVAMSTDHPNGGAFIAYPQIIALLMDRTRRAEVLKRLPPKVRERSVLHELTREYTLNEVAIITRAGPAKVLGLARKGHLGAGADADITIYTPHADIERMFALPKYVYKAGTCVVENGELRLAPYGPTHCVSPGHDAGILPHLKDWFERHYSIRFNNYAVTDDYVPQGIVTNSARATV